MRLVAQQSWYSTCSAVNNEFGTTIHAMLQLVALHFPHEELSPENGELLGSYIVHHFVHSLEDSFNLWFGPKSLRRPQMRAYELLHRACEEEHQGDSIHPVFPALAAS